ncbi:helix-turn-helix transcriptional regulator [Aquabacterium humicola]|uniref:helix-turn-helix transcriptional regulator n=1 Tax=Aquabacterium humicola TaxID=3237377 RepID=UPI0025434AFA|nr:LuxR C-terminal-related transcriptional regulator [Rubrivivax pictus]
MATLLPSGTTGAHDDLLLRIAPPRVPRHLLARPRLAADAPRWRDAPVRLVQAPAGFGKTSLLAQWRREHLAHGTVVAWFTAGERDDPPRLLRGLTLALRAGAGRPTFGHTVLEGGAGGLTGLEAVTAWLAELAHSALDTVLVIDEADRLPEPTRDVLAYLLRNAPPNLRAVVAARIDCRLGLDDLVAYGDCVALGPPQLAFELAETLDLVRQRGGGQVAADDAARLHELTEGWPLGLQLVLAALATAGDARTVLASIGGPGVQGGSGGALHEQLVGLLLANLADDDVAFLTRIAPLELLHPDLCSALAGEPAAPRLARLARDTPVFAVAEQGDWLRLHTLARELLRRRFAALPADEQAALHGAAADWLAAEGFIEDAARHAFSAGRAEQAYVLAERSLYDSLVSRGRQGAVLDWLQRLPQAELDRRPRLLLAAAWTLGLSDRHAEAGRFVARILAQPEVDDALRCECALIESGAAVFADDPDRFAALHDPWADAPPLRGPVLLQVHANRTAFRTLIEGEPALARLRQQTAPVFEHGPALAYVDRWRDFIVALSYLWEGQALLAEQLLLPTLARAEADLGRRSVFACMLATLRAAALWERDRPAEAVALLANRLDVIERSGLPETVLLAFRTLARIAAADGAEHRALELLAALDAVAVARRLPRLRIASLAEQARLHARRYRAESCRAALAQIDALLADPAMPAGRLWRRSVEQLREAAAAHVAIAAQAWRAALEPLQRADAAAQALKLGRLHIELLGLRAFALDRCGERSEALLREATDLAEAYGLQRVFTDAHPDLGRWVAGQRAEPPAAAAPAAPPPVPAAAAALRATPSLALTPKEREVLALLARNLSNKEIGLAMQVGEETIKWHMKNLFAKLDAGTRKQVVQRARLLGLLAAAD